MKSLINVLPHTHTHTHTCAEELLSLLSSGLTGVAEEELEEVLSRSRSEDGTGGGAGGRESRVSLYEFSDPLFRVLWKGIFNAMLSMYMYTFAQIISQYGL